MVPAAGPRIIDTVITPARDFHMSLALAEAIFPASRIVVDKAGEPARDVNAEIANAAPAEKTHRTMRS